MKYIEFNFSYKQFSKIFSFANCKQIQDSIFKMELKRSLYNFLIPSIYDSSTLPYSFLPQNKNVHPRLLDFPGTHLSIL